MAAGPAAAPSVDPVTAARLPAAVPPSSTACGSQPHSTVASTSLLATAADRRAEVNGHGPVAGLLEIAAASW